MQDTIYKRWQNNKIINALKTRRVIILAGARQSGKTTLVRQLTSERNNNKVIYRTLDDVTLLEAALNDPHGFAAHKDELMIIDEIQRAPILLQAIKQDVDMNTKPGRFLLTGSANISSLPNVKESLAGRVRKIRLRPIAEGERISKSPKFIQQAFNELFSEANKTPFDQYNKNYYLELALRGGYPEVLRLAQKDIKNWHIDYLDALIERDLKDIANIRRKASMYKLMEVLAAWSSKFIDISAIGAHLSLARPTLEAYINAIEALFLIERLRPWSKTDYDRVSKHDKLFMTDTGLMASILNWKISNISLNGEKNGKLVETFVFNQLSAIIDTQEENYSLYHYRDREKREIDFIVENEANDILAIEVKAGSAVDKKHFKHIAWFKENMTKNKKFIGIILYTGSHIVSFGDNLWAIPICNLWLG